MAFDEVTELLDLLNIADPWIKLLLCATIYAHYTHYDEYENEDEADIPRQTLAYIKCIRVLLEMKHGIVCEPPVNLIVLLRRVGWYHKGACDQCT